MRRKWESGDGPLQVRCAWLLALACIATMGLAPGVALAEDEEIAFNAGSHTELVRLPYRDYAELVKPNVIGLSTADE